MACDKQSTVATGLAPRGVSRRTCAPTERSDVVWPVLDLRQYLNRSSKAVTREGCGGRLCGAWGASLVNCFCTEEAEVGNFVQQLIRVTPLPSGESRQDGAHAPEQQNVGVGRMRQEMMVVGEVGLLLVS